jgi:integrase
VSLYRKPRSPYWHFDFFWRGHRFQGSTKATTKREAEKIETAERERAKALVAQIESAKTSLRLQDVASRYWTEHGQHLAGTNLWGWLGVVLKHFGKDKLITEITDDDVARLVAWRRGHRSAANAAVGSENSNKINGGSAANAAPLISPHTVNHTVMTLRRLFTRAKLWGVRFDHEPRWSKHLLKTPAERVRELSDDEADKLDAAMRDDYRPFFAFAQATGWRLAECFLRWSEVNFGTGQITKLGKGGRRITVRITSTIRDILWSLQGDHPDFVFTYLCQRREHGPSTATMLGERRPLTYAGVQTEWRRMRKRSGIVGFRFHDYRHDVATKLLRETGNLRLVQKALGHASIKTTTRYAHVLDSEVAEAMERVAKSRTKSRTRLKVV